MKVKDFKKDFGAYMKQYGRRGMELYEQGLITLDEAIKMAHETELKATMNEQKEEILTNIMDERVIITERDCGVIKVLFEATGAVHNYSNYTFDEVVNRLYKAGYAF